MVLKVYNPSKHTHMYIYIYIYIQSSLSLSLSLSLYIYIYIYIYRPRGVSVMLFSRDNQFFLDTRESFTVIQGFSGSFDATVPGIYYGIYSHISLNSTHFNLRTVASNVQISNKTWGLISWRNNKHYPGINARELHWSQFDTGSGNGLVLSGNKSFHEPVLPIYLLLYGVTGT